MTTTTQGPDPAPASTPDTRGAIDITETRQTVGTDAPVWTAVRVIALVLTVIETLLLARFALVLLGANASQVLVSTIYGITDPLVRPFQGIFGQPEGASVDVAAILAVLFFLLLGALVVATVRAVTGRRAPTGSS